MHIVAQIFGAIIAAYATRHVAIKDLASLEGTYWGLHYLDLLATALAGYFGVVAALDAPWWAFLAGLGPVIVWSGVLLGRILHRRHASRKLAEQYLEVCPQGTLTPTTNFVEAVSIALHRCRLTDASRLIHFPFDALKRVFATRVHLTGWLNFEDFRSECTAFWAFGDKCDMRARAGLFAFVDPSAVIQSRRWLREYAVLWKRSYSLKGTDLVNLIRLIWKNRILDRAIQLDCTRRALGSFKTKPRLAKTLCLTLCSEHPDDVWVKDRLLPKLDCLKGFDPKPVDPLEELDIASWDVQGGERECLICRSRPANSFDLRKLFRKHFGKLPRNFRSRYCEACRLDTLEDLEEEAEMLQRSGGHQDDTPLDGVIVQA
jgi:hypothetical protein